MKLNYNIIIYNYNRQIRLTSVELPIHAIRQFVLPVFNSSDINSFWLLFVQMPKTFMTP